MNDDDDLQALSTLITQTNGVAQQVADDMAKMFSKMLGQWICGLCGAQNANTWIASTCANEHVMTTRVCSQCVYMRGPSIMEFCIKCQSRCLDWAIKGDQSGFWSTSWEHGE